MRYPDVLPNKPLIEAVLELGWQQGAENADHSYAVLLGKFAERVRRGYPYLEPLPGAMIPASALPPGVVSLVQHRFRKSQDGWPVVQIGPGIATLNDTTAYVWSDFRKRALGLVRDLYAANPGNDPLGLRALTLRYFNGVPFDPESEDLVKFLAQYLQTEIRLPKALLDQAVGHQRPDGLNLQLGFGIQKPHGVLSFRIATGMHNGVKHLIWETSVSTQQQMLPTMPARFPQWLSAAHAVSEAVFFGLVEGELLERFSHAN